jgi:hypothetical protein
MISAMLPDTDFANEAKLGRGAIESLKKAIQVNPKKPFCNGSAQAFT